MEDNKLIEIENCRIIHENTVGIRNFSWEMKNGEAWLIIGPNGGGKADFIKGLSGQYEIFPNEVTVAETEAGANPHYSSAFGSSVAIVSLEEAARLIEEERERDESEIMDREDEGRTGRHYICEVLGGSSKKGAPLPEIASRLETMPEVKLCGVEKILDRGLRYMSTGEIRRTLLCRALLSGAKLLVLSDPFAGLDAEDISPVYAIYNAMKAAVDAGKEIPVTISASDLCDILKEQFTGDFTYSGVTGTDITWEETGYVSKEAVKYTLKTAN